VASGNPLVITASGTGGGSVQPIDEIVSLRDRSDPSTPARRVLAAVRATPGAVNVSASAAAPMPQISVRFDRRLARAVDVSVGSAAATIEAAFGGAVATQFNTTNGLVYVQVIYAQNHLNDPNAIAAIPFRALNGSIVHVGDFAHLDVAPAPPLITRQDRADVTHVNADVAPG
jgi:multidrug efflux pump subunit AcrB